MDSIHQGHRERLKMRFMEHGLESLSDIEAIELLLFYALPRRDTNALAHALLDHFGSFRQVLEADIPALTRVPGIGQNAAALIHLVAAMNRRYLASCRKSGPIITSSKDAGDYLLPLFAYLTEEKVYVLSLDSKSMVTHCRSVAEGMVNKVDFAIRDIVDIALRDNAASLILAHNHLSGTALPSNADLHTTQKLCSTLASVGVRLADHIIVCDDDYVSLKDSGYFSPY